MNDDFIVLDGKIIRTDCIQVINTETVFEGKSLKVLINKDTDQLVYLGEIYKDESLYRTDVPRCEDVSIMVISETEEEIPLKLLELLDSYITTQFNSFKYKINPHIYPFPALINKIKQVGSYNKIRDLFRKKAE